MLLNKQMRLAYKAASEFVFAGMSCRDAVDNVAHRFGLLDIEVDLLAIRLDAARIEPADATLVAPTVPDHRTRGPIGEGFAEPPTGDRRGCVRS